MAAVFWLSCSERGEEDLMAADVLSEMFFHLRPGTNTESPL